LIQLIQWHDMGIMDVGQLHLHPLQQSCTAQCSQLSSIERLPRAQLGNRIEFSQTKAQVSGLWSYYASPNLIFSMTIKNGFDLGPDLFISDLASKAQYGNAYRQTFSFSKRKSSLTPTDFSGVLKYMNTDLKSLNHSSAETKRCSGALRRAPPRRSAPRQRPNLRPAGTEATAAQRLAVRC
jgi:hypothetical protein